jgi:hypothetical protein
MPLGVKEIERVGLTYDDSQLVSDVVQRDLVALFGVEPP